MSIPDEKCDIRPTRDCQEETRMVPKISLEAKCVPVPRTTCEKVRVPYTEQVPRAEYYCKLNNDDLSDIEGKLHVRYVLESYAPI